MKKFISALLTGAMIVVASISPVTIHEVSAEAQTLFINEIMAANSSTLRDGDVDDEKNGAKGGSYSDWIEIYNAGSQPVNLAGYTISDDSATWTFPQGTVPAKGYILVWASDKDKVAADGQLHTNFKLSSSGETIVLRQSSGTAVDSVTYPALSDDQSYGRTSDGAAEFIVFDISTPRSSNALVTPTNTPVPNTPTPTNVPTGPRTLYINEIMAVNNATIRDGDVDDEKNGALGGSYSDWIELYNSSSQPVNLAGYTISDDSATWTFPQGTVPAKGYILVWASDKDKVAADGQLHTNFKLSSSGETIVLRQSDGTTVDSVTYPVLSDNQSYGRTSDGSAAFTIFDTSTPLSTNNTSTTPTYKVTGYITPNFTSTNSDIKKGFNVEIVELGKSALSDANGYFEISDVPDSQTGYTLKISKSTYLTRQISITTVTDDIVVGSSTSPIDIWSGDIKQDNAINMLDIMQLAVSFNSVASDARYVATSDINMNNVVNMEDVMIVAASFNKTASNYPNITIPLLTT